MTISKTSSARTAGVGIASLAVILATSLLTACSGSSESSSSPPASTVTTSGGRSGSSNLTSLLPEDIQKRGYLTDLLQSPNAPMEYTETNGGPVIGVDIDMADALGQALGVKIKKQYVTDFTQLIPSIQTSRADFVLSAVTDKKSRQQVVNFVDYFQTGSVFMGMTKNSDVRQLTDLCGKTVVAATGTTYPDEVAKKSKEICEGSGKPAIKVITAQSSADQILQVRDGRAVANLVGVEPLAYQMKLEPNQWVGIGEPFARSIYGIVYSKRNDQLGKALQAALQKIIDDGTYAKVLQKWNLSSAAVAKAGINTGTTS